MVHSVPVSQRLSKQIRSLKRKPFREENRLYIAEGEKLCEELLSSAHNAEMIIVKDFNDDNVRILAERFASLNLPIYSAAGKQFALFCDSVTPQSILAVVQMKEQNFMPDKPFIALDGVSDPGNAGTIVRTAEWFGINQIIFGADSADIFNPKTVRSTMGAIFKCNLLYEENLADFIKTCFPKHELFGASLVTANKLEEIKPKNSRFGLVFGNESAGISCDMKELLKKEFKITGLGRSESLNVAVAAGIALYHFAKYL
ncbi:MAG: methyltransferase, TrmH family [Bacteroidota bacterium]|nr:methyltransferase, TrmH family [Bacteroidota bacterium]